MRILLLVLFLLGGAALAQGGEYDVLLKRAQQGDPELDFVALRTAYAQRPEYSGYSSPDIDAMVQAVKASDWPAAEKAARAVLAESYLNLDAHYVLLLAAEQNRDAAGQAHQEYMLKGLSEAIRDGRDGLSPEQAWTVLNVAEEYAVCRLAGWSVLGQSLVNQDGKAYDAMKVKDDAGKAFTVYFDISSFFGKF